jgi:two-component system cell cycle sensor histidine kinase/response regulator CckA
MPPKSTYEELEQRVKELERKAIEGQQTGEEIIKRQRFLESVLYSAPDAIVTLNSAHRILDWNPGAERLFGYRRDEAIGNNLDDLVSRGHAFVEATAITQQVLAGEILHPLETVRYRKDGTPVNVIAAGAPIHVGGKLKGVVAIYTDITDKKRLEAQLRQADRMESIGTLAGGIAHDFNNLLMGIQGRTSLMVADLRPDHPHFEHLTEIEKYVQSAAELTKQLLGFARGGKYEVLTSDLNQLVAGTAHMFGRTKKEIEIHHKFQDDLWRVDVDRSQIEQVLLNIYVNAWQAMPAGGNLLIQTENVILDLDDVKPYGGKPGEFVKVSITDTGIGMDAATLKRVFDPFFTTKEKERGTGLGLASAYGIIKNHDGIISVESEPGQGTTFYICLPASSRPVSKSERTEAKFLEGAETILLVDDEQMIIDVAVQILKRMGYEVIVARGGKEAIGIYRQHQKQIALVILDLVMPDLSGGEVYDQLTALDPDVKVLLSSGYSRDGKAGAILRRGCRGFIQKPFNINELSRKLREILD